MTKILIGTPTRGQVFVGYMRSVVNTLTRLSAEGIPVAFAITEATNIANQRNYMATRTLIDKSLTHLLSIDSDTVFEYSAVKKMLVADKPVIGCIYPKRTLHPVKLMQAARNDPDDAKAYAKGVEFVVSHEDVAYENAPIAKVRTLGMGLTLIRRDVFEALAKHPLDQKDAHSFNFPHPLIGFFNHLPNLAEDVSFFERWRTLCGGDIYAVTDEAIGHIGNVEVRATYGQRW